MKRTLLSSVFLTFAASLAAEESTPPTSAWPCVESVVIARIARVGDMLDYNTEEGLVLHPPSHVDLRVTQVLWGVRPPRALTIVHQPQRQHGDAMFLLGRRDGHWFVLGFEGRVVRDRKGRYVVPFFEAPHEDYLAPRGWIPRDYSRRLREIQYDPRKAAWMGEQRKAQPGWGRIEGAYAVANRGLVLDDLESLLAQRRAAPCERDAPRRLDG
jgi:hypothetical protein